MAESDSLAVQVACCDVSPTRITVRPPNVEMSNRPLQHYKHLISSERFLRVTLADETGARLFADTDRSLDVLHRYMHCVILDETYITKFAPLSWFVVCSGHCTVY